MSQEPVISAQDTLRVSVLSEALPYIQRFAGRRVVVKYGGAAMVRQDLRDAVFRDLALLACVGVQPVVVHGGGPEINQWLGRLAIEPPVETFEPGPTLATQLAVPLGGSGKLLIPIARAGGFAGPVAIGFRGLPDGVTAPAESTIAAGAAAGAVELVCSADAGTTARLATLILAGTTSAGRVLTHRLILGKLWGASGDVQQLRVYVRQLRQKLERNPERPTLIITETGIGYRLVSQDTDEGKPD